MLETPPPSTLPNNRTRHAPGPWRIEDIIDGRALRIKLTTAAHMYSNSARDLRAGALDILHGALFRGRLIAQERLYSGADGLDTARLLAAVQDEVLSALYDFTTVHVFRARNPTEGEKLAVCATGGYGRGVLAPSSDIDLLFVRRYKKSPWAESVIEYMLYMLWDMGLKVGHAFRTVDECIRLARDDVTIKTSLLDGRFLFGDRALTETLAARFRKECVAGRDAQFISDKLAERDARHTRQGDTRYVVEPNVKEGKGGLRDLQVLFWIAKHLYGGDELEDVMRARAFTKQEFAVFTRAARFLWTVRCHLHYLTGRAEERISFDLQPELAKRLGYEDRENQLAVERFMKRYFVAAKDVGGLTRILSAKMEAEYGARSGGFIERFWPGSTPKPLPGAPGFVVEGARLSIVDETILSETPINLIRLFALTETHNLDIHPKAMTAAARHAKALRPNMRRKDEVRTLFLDCLLKPKAPARVLRLMNEAGILGRVLPEFGAIVAQTQFNMYHHYTVDEHTLRTIQAMSDIEHGRSDVSPLAHQNFQEIEHRRALYLAMLLHDTGKGQGDQQVEGMRTARKACRRLGLPDSEADLVAWLVGHHLEMSETAQKRDTSDPRTVAHFAKLVGGVERLKLLHILTVADIKGVGPHVWNSWKGQLLGDLYHNTVAALRGGRADEAAVTAQLERRAEARRTELGAIPAIMDEMETAYWTSFDVEDLRSHAAHLQANDGPIVEIDITPEQDTTRLFVSGEDRVGLFADIVGRLVAEGANITSAQVFTGQSGRVIDVFQLQDQASHAFGQEAPDRLMRLTQAIQDGLDGAPAPPPGKPRPGRREAAFKVQPSVQVSNELSSEHTVIDMGGRDRPGLLRDVAATLADLELSIHSAHVGSYGERVFDAFYVQTAQGEKVTDQGLIEDIKHRLLAILARHEPDAPQTPARTLARAEAQDSF